jgi:DNA-binding transcriptional MerR regulator
MTTVTAAPTYTIEQVAAETGLTPHTLRYYERIGLIEDVPRATSGHRRYTEDDLGWVRFVVMLRQTGMSIADSLHFMELTRAGDHTIPDRVRLLRTHRDDLVAQLAVLQRHLGAINRKIDIYEGLLGLG